MSNEMDSVYEALDRMAEAGWVSEYARDAKNTAVQWTDKGKQVAAAIYFATQDLGPNLSKELWWNVAFVASLRFGPGGKGFEDLGIPE
jgi:DNA-binding PadR family transcriptional regulator